MCITLTSYFGEKQCLMAIQFLVSSVGFLVDGISNSLMLKDGLGSHYWLEMSISSLLLLLVLCLRYGAVSILSGLGGGDHNDQCLWSIQGQSCFLG
jgi:hypothetical protein